MIPGGDALDNHISHHLGVVAQTTENVAVMYLGQVVEYADVKTLFHDPRHPYNRALRISIPRLGKTAGQTLESIKVTIPDPYRTSKGCRFHARYRLYSGQREIE